MTRCIPKPPENDLNLPHADTSVRSERAGRVETHDHELPVERIVVPAKEAVNAVLEAQLGPNSAVEQLLARDLKKEA